MKQRLILVGAGHAHAEVLARFALAPVPGLEIVLVTPHRLAPYSGMIPGWLAGGYSWEDCCIDFADLASRAGARLVEDSVVQMDARNRSFSCARGGSLVGDVASLNIGSTVFVPDDRANGASGPIVLPMRPLAELRTRTEASIVRLSARRSSHRATQIVAVGGGAAGFESLLAIRARCSRLGLKVRGALVAASDDILPGLARRAASLGRALLRDLGLSVHTGSAVAAIGANGLSTKDGTPIDADLALWATGGVAHAWPREGGLAVDEQGFVRVDATLRSISHPWLHAVGDCAALDGHPVPKSGVVSVRMGPVLADNLHAVLSHRPLRAYRPQRFHLALLNCANGRAIAAWGPLAWEGASVWAWKNRIDRRFIARYMASPAKRA